MDLINFQDFVYETIEDTLNAIKNILRKYEYCAGYYQRLADGYGFIHAPRKKLPFGNPVTELLLDFFAENRALNEGELSKIFSETFIKRLK